MGELDSHGFVALPAIAAGVAHDTKIGIARLEGAAELHAVLPDIALPGLRDEA